jgi:hypothetical protein
VVKVGFIVEGDTEKILLESTNFKDCTAKIGVDICHPIENAKGSGNLLPKHIGPLVERLTLQNPTHIIILTDLENDPDKQAVIDRIGTDHTQLIFIAVKAIEAWFLADTLALNNWLKLEGVYEDFPETTPEMPWERLKSLASEHSKRGPGGSKPVFARQMTKHHGFSLERAANHANCPSATEFYNFLYDLGGWRI